MNEQTNGSLGPSGGAALPWERLCPAAGLADLVTDRVFVVDGGHRIVRANRAFLEAFGLDGEEATVGRTLGAVASCRHAERGGGCGGAAECAECGWLLAVQACAAAGRGGQECRILRQDGLALDFAVAVAPSDDGAYRVCGLKDLYAAKRLRVLERAFFHDVMNLAAGIRGLCELEQDQEGDEGAELRRLIHDGADKLADEVERLRGLRVAENGDLRVFLSTVSPDEVLQHVAGRFQEDADARHLEVVIDLGAAPAGLETDKDLLPSLLGEFMRNAIEASKRGDRLTLACAADGDRVVFSVHNPAALDRQAQAHVFERSFSTKGPGHGIGTYRAKLIAERYLGGSAGFVARDGEGTTFSLTFPLAGASAPG